MDSIELALAGESHLFKLLTSHPKIDKVVLETGLDGVMFVQNGQQRRVLIGDCTCELKGLVELIDNNPLVCADRFSVPDAVSTLALIALGPLAESGLLLEAPVLLANCSINESKLTEFLNTIGWTQGVNADYSDMDLHGVFAATVIAAISTPDIDADIDSLYAERFGRSFIRRVETSIWDAQLAKDQPYAVYRLSYAPGELSSLLTVQVMADANGKCGAAQVLHAMNIMSCLEETMGIDCEI